MSNWLLLAGPPPSEVTEEAVTDALLASGTEDVWSLVAAVGAALVAAAVVAAMAVEEVLARERALAGEVVEAAKG
jgi:hypothetical protein